MKELYENIDRLVSYALKQGLIPEEEIIYSRNLLLDLFQEEEYEQTQASDDEWELCDILKNLLDIAVKKNLIGGSIVFRDLFDTRIMNTVTPRPGQVIDRFWEEYKESPRKATDYFYKFSQDTDYIRRYRLCKDERWTVESDYGTIDISINLSKPEKDPRAIAAAKTAKQSGYPKCLLCMENVGYAGRANHPARQTHRIIPLTINNSGWGLQYSPYGYYNEHCILLNAEHVPMKIERDTFVKLFDFVRQFPHYFIGSNADLPIVGGSILSHDHYQGGRYEFAMAKAPLEKEYKIPGYEDIQAGIVKWPMSVIRIQGEDEQRLIYLASHILDKWRGYTDESVNVYAYTDDEPHNTITPIARMKNGLFQLDLVLRNNITTEERPYGLFHPREDYHHIKKENIGLIEVMGLAVLPARLKEDMSAMKDALLGDGDFSKNPILQQHADWLEKVKDQYDDMTEQNVVDILKKEIGMVFVGVLEDAGVYKWSEEGQSAFERFIRSL